MKTLTHFRRGPSGGLPDSYDVLVTALESGSEMVESVTERLLREEQKMSEKGEDASTTDKAVNRNFAKGGGGGRIWGMEKREGGGDLGYGGGGAT